MNEKIDQKQELLDSAIFNQKKKSLLKNDTKSLTNRWLVGVLYTRWKKVEGIREESSHDGSSSFKEWNKKVEDAIKCQS